MIKKLLLINIIAFSTSYLNADATEDLFTAIEKADVNGVEKALANGADVTQTKNNQTAYTLAKEKDNEARKYLQSYKGIIPLLASLGLHTSAILHNPIWGSASTAASLGANLCSNDSSPATMGLGVGLSLLGCIGLGVNAWRSKHTILSAIGATGMLIATYQLMHMSARSHVSNIVRDATESAQMHCED